MAAVEPPALMFVAAVARASVTRGLAAAEGLERAAGEPAVLALANPSPLPGIWAPAVELPPAPCALEVGWGCLAATEAGTGEGAAAAEAEDWAIRSRASRTVISRSCRGDSGMAGTEGRGERAGGGGGADCARLLAGVLGSVWTTCRGRS